MSSAMEVFRGGRSLGRSISPAVRAAVMAWGQRQRIRQAYRFARPYLARAADRARANLGNARKRVRTLAYTPMGPRVARARRPSAVGAGHFVGRFKAPQRPSAPSAYAKRGVQLERDVYGTQTMNECCYVGVRSVVPYEMGVAVGIALIRDIMKKKYGIEITSPLQSLTYTFTQQSNAVWESGNYGGDIADALAGNPTYKGGPQSIAFYRECLGDLVSTVHRGEFQTNDEWRFDFTIPSSQQIAYPALTVLNPHQTMINQGRSVGTRYFRTAYDFGDWFARRVFLNKAFNDGDFALNDTVVKTTGTNLTVNNADYNLMNLTRYQLAAYQLHEWDYVGGDSGYIKGMGIVDIRKLIVKAYSFCNFQLQNATAAAGAAGDPLDADRIDSNPVRGKCFKFSQPLPRLADHRYLGLQSLAAANVEEQLCRDWATDHGEDGVILPANSMPAASGFNNVPRDDMFRNCSGVSHVGLQPGEIKKLTVKFVFDGFISKLMSGFKVYAPRTITGTTTAVATIDNQPTNIKTAGHLDKQHGTAYLFALEQIIRNGSGGVTVAYEAKYNTGAVIKKRITPTMRKMYVNQAGVTNA